MKMVYEMFLNVNTDLASTSAKLKEGLGQVEGEQKETRAKVEQHGQAIEGEW